MRAPWRFGHGWSMGCRTAILAGGVAIAALMTTSANAAVLITVDKSTQRMTVQVDGATRWQWKVSTGRTGHDTPAGSFRALSLDVDHHSRKYDNAPMPHSIFFTDLGHAIHGSFAVSRLGTRASHGCVRLDPANATRLFALVGQQGMRNTTIIVANNAADAAARARTPAPSAPTATATAAPSAPPAHAVVPTIPAGAIAMPPLQLTLTPPPAATQPTYRQAFLPQYPEPPVAPTPYPPFPLPWSVSGDLR
jgi:L,D-transpeptidase catalytic domain